MMGIYCIEWMGGELYYGSSVTIHKRWNQHKSGLRKNKHCNLRLQHMYNKYGAGYISYTVIEIVESEELLLEREQFYLDYAFSVLPKNQRLNLGRVAGASSRGIPMSAETRAKISAATKGRAKSETERKRLIEYNIGRVFSEETRQKISSSNKGKLKGKPKSEETRRKMAESAKALWAKRKTIIEN
jgi:group I intron endonuclease